jgi:hypothetical protein
MPRKTQEQIEIEIAALKELLPQMRNYKRGIEVSLRVLENGMTSDTMFGAYEGSDLFDDAHAAVLWRDGNGGDAPSVQFREML